ELRRRCAPRRRAAPVRRVARVRAGAGGFEPVPPPAKRPALAAGDTLRRVSGTRLLWSAAAGAPVLVGAEGHVAETALDEATVARLIALLDDGCAHPLRRLRALAGDAPARRALDALLADLVAWRALRRRRG
ncbi:MAG: hypothetical protein ACTHOH_17360, partial [Lysobacteraceae bacterium]